VPFGLELRCYRGMRRATSEYCFSPFLTHNGNDADIAFPVLQSLAGHTNPRTTMKYVDVFSEQKRIALE